MDAVVGEGFDDLFLPRTSEGDAVSFPLLNYSCPTIVKRVDVKRTTGPLNASSSILSNSFRGPEYPRLLRICAAPTEWLIHCRVRCLVNTYRLLSR